MVVAATGNSGPRNPETNWPLGSPATALNAIAVAASNDGPYPVVEVVAPTGTGLKNIMGGYADIAPEFREGSTFSIVDAGYGSKADFAAASVKGKVALVERGPLGRAESTSATRSSTRRRPEPLASSSTTTAWCARMTLRVAAGDETRTTCPASASRRTPDWT